MSAYNPAVRNGRDGRRKTWRNRRPPPRQTTRQHGEMAERFKAPVLKTGVAAMPPWVRIPLSPPFPAAHSHATTWLHESRAADRNDAASPGWPSPAHAPCSADSRRTRRQVLRSAHGRLVPDQVGKPAQQFLSSRCAPGFMRMPHLRGGATATARDPLVEPRQADEQLLLATRRALEVHDGWPHGHAMRRRCFRCRQHGLLPGECCAHGMRRACQAAARPGLAVVAPCARLAVPAVGPQLAGYPPQANERASPRLRPSSQRGDGHESGDETRVTRR